MMKNWTTHNFLFNLQTFAKKKGGGSTKNGRDSNPKYLGIKRSDGTFVKSGELIYLQRGTIIHPGKNVKKAKNDTLYAIRDGYVSFFHISRKRRAVSVLANKQEKTN